VTPRPPRVLAAALLAAATVQAQEPGGVVRWQKISRLEGGGALGISAGDQFGRAVAAIGDLDGDGIAELAVGAHHDTDGGTLGTESKVGSVWILFLNPDGTVRARQKISATRGGFPAGFLADGDEFGAAIGGIGDLDGDGVPDMAVGARNDDDGGANKGALYLVRLLPDGTVKAATKISETSGGFGAKLEIGDELGRAIASLGDLDGDGVADLAVGAALDNDGGLDRGAVYVLFLQPDGSVKAQQKISDKAGGFLGGLQNHDSFGISVACLGDLGGDGVVDLCVGAIGDDTEGPQRGAVWIVHLNPDGTVKAQSVIDSRWGNFRGVLSDQDEFGFGVASLGDFDGDGVVDVVVGAPLDDAGGAQTENYGAIYVLHLASDGKVASHRKIGRGSGGFSGLRLNDWWGTAIAGLGDLDGDGSPDVAVGSRFDDDGARDTGAVYVLFLADGLPVPSFQTVVDPLTRTAVFTDASTGGVTAWSWSFGDGSSSTESSPVHVYAAPGTYTVELLATNANGSRSHAEALVVAEPPPAIDFTASPSGGPAPLAVGFQPTSAGGPVTAWSWSFGDGTGSTESAPVHVYDAGVWTVSLTATGPGGTVTIERPGAVIAEGLPTQAPGDVLGFHKLNGATQVPLSSLAEEDRFGVWVEGIGDFDGDGHPDAAVGAHRDDDGSPDAGAVWLLFLRADGTVREAHKISATSGGFTGTLEDSDRFGKSVASLGDLDGDGVLDLAVGAYQDDDGGVNRGAVYVLFLNADGTVRAHQKISAREGGLGDRLSNESSFGWAVEGIGDFDGDGVPDLAVGQNRDGDGGYEAGAVWLLLLNPDGTVRESHKIGSGTPGLGGPISSGDRFGADVAPLGDLDGDGVLDLAVGAWKDDDGGHDRGAVWLLFLGADGTLRSSRKIGAASGVESLQEGDGFGIACQSLGDLDGDGWPELAVGAFDRPVGGSLWILSLGPGGDLLGVREIGAGPPAFLPLADDDRFGGSIALLGDADGDGSPEVLVGAYHDDDGGENRGAAWRLELFAAPTPAPTADFALAPAAGQPPLEVLFTNHSTGMQDGWTWSFGDGTTSAARSPRHVYGAEGTYGVTLTARGPGGEDTLVRLAAVSVQALPPTASFDATPAEGPAPLTVSFQDTSTGTRTAWSWDFGDGTGSTDPSPVHVYGPGTFTARLTVQGPGGAGSAELGITSHAAPLASFSASPTAGDAPLSVAFADASAGTITDRAWDFGDGSTSTLADPTHVYEQPGTYAVTLTVSGPGGSDTLALPDAVEVGVPPPPVAAFAATPRSGVAPLAVDFAWTGSGTATGWAWDFGDGATSSEAAPRHVYVAAGTYRVALAVSGPAGSDATALDAFVQVSEPVVAEFSVTPSTGVAPLEVSFQSLASGPVDGLQWDFGDGGGSSEPAPVHTYALAGIYPVTLAATGATGTDSVTRELDVRARVGFADGGFETGAPGGPPPGWVTLGPPTAAVLEGGESGWPSGGARWCRLDASGTAGALPPAAPGAAGTPPEGGAGITQTFRCPEGAPILVFDACFLSAEPAGDPLRDDWMSVDVTDGVTWVNLFYADGLTPPVGTSSLSGLPRTELQHVRADLSALFPGSDTFTTFRVTAQVGNALDGLAPSQGYVDSFALDFEPVIPGLERLGCGGNPAGSMTYLSGSASIGSTLRFALHNPLGTQAPGSATLLALSHLPTLLPCGVPGYGMAGSGAIGELLISTQGANPFKFIWGAPWSGTPVSIPFTIPNQSDLVGRTIYLQGQIIDSTQTYGVERGLTSGYALTFQP